MKCTSWILSHFDACSSYVCSTPKSSCKALLSLFKIQTKGSILYLALVDNISLQEIPALVSTFECAAILGRFSLSVPNALHMFLQKNKNKNYPGSSVGKSYMYYNHVFTISLYHYLEYITFLYF